MCGQPMGAEVALLGDVASLEPDGFWIEPPVHERCAELAAAGLCPFVSRQRVPRRPPEAGVAIIGTGPGRARRRWPGPSPSGRWIVAITRTYTAGLVISGSGSPVMVYQAGPIERVRRYAWDAAGKLAEVLPAPPPDGTGGSQPAPPQAAEPTLSARRQDRRCPRSARTGTRANPPPTRKPAAPRHAAGFRHHPTKGDQP